MQEFTLPSPNIGGKGHHLRRIAANAISQLEMSAMDYASGIHPGATELAAFFTACATAATETGKTTPVLAFTPTAKSYTVAGGATAGPTLSKGGAAGTASYVSSDPTIATVNSSTGVVTAVKIGVCTITVTNTANGIYRAAEKSYVATVTA